MNGCKYCEADKNGQYSAVEFSNEDGSEKITLFYNGGQITMDLKLRAMRANMSHPIYYCPMCGRQVKRDD